MTILLPIDSQVLAGGAIRSIDLSGFADTDFITCACPTFPLNSINTAQSFLDLTSNPNADFDAGPTVSLAFSTSISPLVNGLDSELRFSISTIAALDKASITGVRFRVEATAPATFRCLAIRAISADWKLAPLDTNTLYKRIQHSVPLNGSAAVTPTFPKATAPVTPVTWPVIYRSDEPTGTADPRPIDAALSAVFNTGASSTLTNLLINPSFEANLNDWVASASNSGTTTFQRTNTWAANSGGYSARVTIARTDGAGATLANVTASPVTAGAAYSVRGTINVLQTHASEQTVFRVYWYKADQTTPTTTTPIVNAANTPAGATGIFDISGTVIAPADAAYAWVAIYNGMSTTGLVTWDFYADHLILVKASAAPAYFDGSYGGEWTGSANNSTSIARNAIALHFREQSLDEMTQLDLNTVTMDDLDADGEQPDFGIAKFNNRVQSDLDTLPQSALNAETQFNLERTQDYLSSAYIEARISWSTTASRLTVKDAQGVGYTFSPTLSANGDYALYVDLEDESIRVQILSVDDQGTFDWAAPAFDTGYIIDPALVRRRRGRIGWWAQLVDGNASLRKLRTHKLNYGEFRSHPFRSSTPVSGAALYAGGSPDRELITGIERTSTGVTLGLDATKSNSGKALKITTTGTVPPEGIRTNEIYLDNPEDTTISFDLNTPTVDSIEVFLVGEYNRIVPLPLPPLVANQWQSIVIDLDYMADEFQPGPYRLHVIQTLGGATYTWYVDRMSIQSRVVRWELRPHPDDAWGMQESEWLAVKSTLNTGHGVTFPEEGAAVQVRGIARRGDAVIANYKVVPKYAELGRLVWSDPDDTINVIPAAQSTGQVNFTWSPTDGQYTYVVGVDTIVPAGATWTDINTPITFTASAVLPPGRTVAEYRWDFGDGTSALGNGAVHTYTLANVQASCTLRVTDDQGRQYFCRKQLYLH